MNLLIKLFLSSIIIVLMVFLFTQVSTLDGDLISEFISANEAQEEDYDDEEGK